MLVRLYTDYSTNHSRRKSNYRNFTLENQIWASCLKRSPFFLLDHPTVRLNIPSKSTDVRLSQNKQQASTTEHQDLNHILHWLSPLTVICKTLLITGKLRFFYERSLEYVNLSFVKSHWRLLKTIILQPDRSDSNNFAVNRKAVWNNRLYLKQKLTEIHTLEQRVFFKVRRVFRKP